MQNLLMTVPTALSRTKSIQLLIRGVFPPLDIYCNVYTYIPTMYLQRAHIFHDSCIYQRCTRVLFVINYHRLSISANTRTLQVYDRYAIMNFTYEYLDFI